VFAASAEAVHAGMMPGITDTLKKVASDKKLDYDEWAEKLKKENRFHVEVY
jgi:sulfite reductase alpha subunit-like flavoprotein